MGIYRQWLIDKTRHFTIKRDVKEQEGPDGSLPQWGLVGDSMAIST
jgi:hypothetical protein